MNLNDSKILLEYFINEANTPIVSLTQDFRIDKYNKAFEKLTHYSDSISDELFENVIGKINVSSEKVIDKNYDVKEINCIYKSKSGSKTHLRGSLIRKESELIIIFKSFQIIESEIVSEISRMNVEMSNLTRELAKKNFDLKLANEKITKLTNTDFLTGLPNRKYFFERLDELISLKKRKNSFNIGVIFIDIDFFKKFNDTYGHDKGDLILIKFSEMLKNNLRKEDVVARIGGEEFCIIVQYAGENCLLNISEKLRKSCELILVEDIDDKLTASFGATIYRESEDRDSLMKRADANMYEAKINGRNQVVFR